MHVIILFFAILFLAQALTLVLISVPVGRTLQVNVSYTYPGQRLVIVEWFFNGSLIIGKTGNNPPVRENSRTTIRGKASLVVFNTTLRDNGTYSLRVGLHGGVAKMSSFQVIVEGTVSKSMSFSKREIQAFL